MRLPGVVAAFIPLLALASPSGAGDTYGGVTSRMEPARAHSAGGAGCAVSADPSLAWLNPGVLATCSGKSLAFGAQRGTSADLSSQLQWTSPLVGGNVTTGLGYYSAGSAEYWLPDGSSRTIALQRDTLFFAGWGGKVMGNIGGGLNLKAVSTELAEAEKSSAFGIDMGFHLAFNDMFSGGVAVQNLGSEVKWGRDALSQPALVRTGVATVFPVRENIMGDPADFLQLMQDFSYSFLDGVFISSTGAEYQWNNAAFARLGVRARSKSGLTGFTAGAGIRTAVYRLDYSVWIGAPIEIPHILTITFFLS